MGANAKMKPFLVLLVCGGLAVAATSPEELSDAAQKLAIEKHYAEAERLWLEALQLSPRFFPALFNLGYMYFSIGQPERAEPVLRRAVEISPRDYGARYVLGAALARLKKTDDALLQWRAALEIQPENVRLMQVMAVEYSQGRYFQEAAAKIGRAHV